MRWLDRHFIGMFTAIAWLADRVVDTRVAARKVYDLDD